jgi:hypothetical protein
MTHCFVDERHRGEELASYMRKTASSIPDRVSPMTFIEVVTDDVNRGSDCSSQTARYLEARVTVFRILP